jgi:hypothetical protein
MTLATRLAVRGMRVVGTCASVVHAQSSADSGRAQTARDTASFTRDTNPSRGATLIGRVVQADTTPVAQAVVMLLGTNDSAVTNAEGRFVVRDAPPGVYMVSVRRLGFGPERFATTLPAGQTRDVTIALTRVVPILPTVTTTAQERAAYRSVGLDQRMRMGIGQYLTYDQIVRKQATTFSQLLQSMRGIRLWQNQHQFGTSAESTRGAGSCVAYVVDGVPQNQMMDLQPSLSGADLSIGPESADNLIEPSLVGAIEVYSSAGRPTGFGGTIERPLGGSGDHSPSIDLNAQQCVLVMVWTRARLGLTAGGTAATANGAVGGEEVTRGRAAFSPDAACNPPSSVDTTDLAVYATVQGSPPASMSDTAWAQYKGNVLGVLDRWSVLPSQLILPTFGLPFARRAGSDAAASAHPDLDVAPTISNVIVFTLDATGALTSARVAASSLSGGADTSMLAMVERAGAAHDFPRLPPVESRPDSVHLYLVVASVEPVPGTRAAILGQLEVPVWRLSRPARLAAGQQPGDGDARRDSVRTDRVTAELIVDAEGRAVETTARILGGAGAKSDESAGRFLHMLQQFQFEPALIGACRISQLIIQSFAIPNRDRLAR